MVGAAVSDRAGESCLRHHPGNLPVALERVLRARPREAAAWVSAARLLQRHGDLRTARLCAEAAASLSPCDPGVVLARAEVLAAVAGGAERARYDLGELAAAGGPGGEIGRRAARLLSRLRP